MPVLIPIVLCWLAGLAIAAIAAEGSLPAGAFHGAVIACAILVALAILRSVCSRSAYRHRWPALAAVLLAGLVTGGAHARRQRACMVALSRESTLRVAIDERAGPNARVTGHATSMSPALAGCAVRASVHVSEGHAPAGSIVGVTGAFRATERALRIDGAITETGQRETLRAWRGRTGETIDTLFGANAALVRALLIADQDGISPTVRDRFADAGLVHMLSISGLHVAIIAGSLLTVASALRLSRDRATAASLVVITVYVLMLGAPAPAVRSAVMLATVSLSERLQRPVHPWTALALGAAIPTVNPAVVLDLGYQLSVGGMASLVAARSVIRRLRQSEIGPPVTRLARAPHTPAWLPVNLSRTLHAGSLRVSKMARASRVWLKALRGWQWTLARDLLTGVIATAVTAPLIAWTFGRVSIVAPLSNLLAGPVVAFLQPALFLAILLARWRSAARLVADATIAPLALLDRIASASAAVPHASLHVAPTLFGAVCAGVASAAFVRSTASRRMWPGMIVCCGALTLAVWAPAFAVGSGSLELHMIDVGQGDAIAIRTPRGRWVVVDAGRRWDGGDAGRRLVVPYIQRRGGEVAAFVMSHAHDDHVGGAASVIEALSPLGWWEPAFVTASGAYRAALVAVQRQHATWHRATPRARFVLDGVAFTMLAPDSAWTAAQQDANETSVVMRVEFGSTRFLLTGDAEVNEEAWMVSHLDPADLRADVLKVGHHGSRTSSSPPFLDAVRPRLAVVSVGTDNKYGHPSPETLLALALRNVPVLRTDRDGSIVVRSDGRRLTAETQGQRWPVPPD